MRKRSIAVLSFLVLCLGAVALVATPAPDGNSVLFLEPTLYASPNSPEELSAAALGLTVVTVDAATWGAMSAADFASYRAIVLGDGRCSTDVAAVAAAEANAAVWGPAVTGNVIIIGADPVYHIYSGEPGAQTLVDGGMDFATSDALKTGAFLSLSCYYHFQPALTAVPVLDGFSAGGFTVIGANHLPGLNDVHIVATHPALAGLTDADLSDWYNSVHEGFDSWPVAFEALAVARDPSGSFVAPDGTVGYPYILARGVTVISNITLSPETATNPIYTDHIVTATVEEDGSPVAGTTVDFEIVAGPNIGLTFTDTTDAAGMVSFTYSSTVAGIDTIQATYVSSTGVTQRSNRVTKEWLGVLPILCDAGPDDSVNEASTYTLDGTGSSGGFDPLTYLWSGPYTLDDPTSATPTFSTPVVDGNMDAYFELTVTDAIGEAETCGVFITVIDSDLPPDCSNASASIQTLWPPNHKMKEIGVTGVVDPEDPTVLLLVTGVTQDEPTNGLGDGDKSPDAAIDGSTARVRAERSGLEDGRVYMIEFVASDALGQACWGAVSVGVPHDKKDTPVDSGQDYDSTVD